MPFLRCRLFHVLLFACAAVGEQPVHAAFVVCNVLRGVQDASPPTDPESRLQYWPFVLQFVGDVRAELGRKLGTHREVNAEVRAAGNTSEDPASDSSEAALQRLKAAYRRMVLRYRMFERSRRDVAHAAREVDAWERPSQRASVPSSVLRLDFRSVPVTEQVQAKDATFKKQFDVDRVMAQVVRVLRLTDTRVCELGAQASGTGSSACVHVHPPVSAGWHALAVQHSDAPGAAHVLFECGAGRGRSGAAGQNRCRSCCVHRFFHQHAANSCLLTPRRPSSESVAVAWVTFPLLRAPSPETCIPRQPVGEEAMLRCFGTSASSKTTKILVASAVGFRSPTDFPWHWIMGRPVSGCDHTIPCVWSADLECRHAADVILIADWVAHNIPYR